MSDTSLKAIGQALMAAFPKDPKVIALDTMSLAELRAAYGEAILVFQAANTAYWTCVDLEATARNAWIADQCDATMDALLKSPQATEDAKAIRSSAQFYRADVLRVLLKKQKEESKED